MKNLRSSYVYRGDGLRRRRRIRRALFVAGLALFGIVVYRVQRPEEAVAEPARSEPGVPFYLTGEARRLQVQLNRTRGDLDLVTAQLERANRVIYYSTRYKIGADLAGLILDVALAEGIEPELAFRLVKIESQFNDRAVSSVGAIGLTQVMPNTARYFERGITREALFERRTNLRIGFRYLRALIGEYGGDVKIALLVYNRGPVAVNAALQQGRDPANGYDRAVMRGFTGKALVD